MNQDKETTRMVDNIYTSGSYLAKNPSWDVEDSPWKATQVLKMLKRSRLQPNTICEIGCGAGEILNQLYDHLPNQISFTGYDISPYAYEMAKGRSKDRLSFRLGDMLQEDTEHFDLLLIMDVVEHVEDYFGFFKGLRSKADYKLFHIPLDMSVRKVLCGVPMQRRNQFGHIHYFMKETALATLTDTGYEIVDYFYTSIDLDHPAKTVNRVLCKTLLKAARAIHEDIAVRILGGHSLMVLAK
jgi:hypothetical protein